MADVILAVKQILAPTATGSVAYSMPTELGGKTPKAILVFAPGGAAAGGGSGAAFLNLCGGMAVNGGNQNYTAMTSDDAVTSTNTISEWGTDAVATTAVTGPGNYRCAVSAWSADGFTLNWTTLASFAQSMPLFVVIIAGDDAAAYTAYVSLGTGTSAINITAPNFQPDVVLFFGCQTANAASAHADGAAWGWGAATPTQQRSIMWGENDAIGTGGQPACQVRNDYAWIGVTRSTGALAYGVTCNDFDAQGFSLTPSASATNHNVGYIALNLGGLGVKLLDFVTKTSTGTQAYTGAGFQPMFGLLCCSNMAALNTGYFNQVEAVGISIGAFDKHGNQCVLGVFEDDTSDPTNNGQWILNGSCLMAASRTTPGSTIADLDSLDSDGVTFDYTVSAGGTQRGFMLLVQDAGTAPVDEHRVTLEGLVAGFEEADIRNRTSQAALVNAFGELAVNRTSQLAFIVARLGIARRQRVFANVKHNPFDEVRDDIPEDWLQQ